ncbi:unnamed protein product [Triticum turgidum subsp. durum]|uniref:DUF6598 domain-containing protein n=1 Tax=Triticum turgidum subsp. durum TaxID=4567 RepID=A0A9R0RSF0_TRITD|nr:unnamed protein product [Triticum turgidum subsp. durum]
MEELTRSGLAGMDFSIFRGESEGERGAGGNHECINIRPPSPSPCANEEQPPPEKMEQEEEEGEGEKEEWVYREEDRITRGISIFDDFQLAMTQLPPDIALDIVSMGCWATLGPMRFTFGPIPSYARPHCTIQIFGIRVANLEDGLQWPLHVHGFVAARDTSDHNRNFLFNRTSDNCQDPYLLLTGPSRAIVIIDPITIEFQLKVKSKTDPEEVEMLAFGIFNYPQTYLATHVIRSGILCDRCTIQLAYAPLDPSVEATVIHVRIIDGVWPEGLRGRVVAEVTTVREGEVLLLDSRDGKMPISPSTGAVELSRHVVSVDLEGGKLVVSVVASPQTAGKEDGDDGGGAAVVVARGEAVFTPERAGTSNGTCDLGFCKVEVAVAWLQQVFESSWPPGVLGLRRLLGAAAAAARVEARAADEAHAFAGAAAEGIQRDLQVDDVPKVLRDVNLLLPSRDVPKVLLRCHLLLPSREMQAVIVLVLAASQRRELGPVYRGRSHQVPPWGPLSVGMHHQYMPPCQLQLKDQCDAFELKETILY